LYYIFITCKKKKKNGNLTLTQWLHHYEAMLTRDIQM